jgi:CheY-like chemotaxis protein
MAVRALVVEDDDDIRVTLRDVLMFFGITVDAVANGAEALRWLDGSAAPDVILLDLVMPVMDGWQFMRALRERGADLPVCVLSATPQSPPEGAAEVLNKPISAGRLLAAVHRHARRSNERG